MRSDNPVGAENQQERLIEFRGWVIGFVDGEGCFSVGFIRQPNRKGRRGYRTGYQIAHEFAVTQGRSSLACLQALQEFFGVGMLVANRRYDDHREPCIAMSFVDARTCWRGSFRSSSGIRCAAKQQNFEKFARCVELVAGGRHLTAEGL